MFGRIDHLVRNRLLCLPQVSRDMFVLPHRRWLESGGTVKTFPSLHAAENDWMSGNSNPAYRAIELGCIATATLPLRPSISAQSP